MFNVVDLLVAQGRPDLEHDVGLGEQLITRRERCAGFLVVFIQKLCIRPGIAFDQNLSEAFFAKESDVLRCKGDATFIWENFSGHSYPQGRVRCALESGFAFRGEQVDKLMSKNIPDSKCADADVAASECACRDTWSECERERTA